LRRVFQDGDDFGDRIGVDDHLWVGGDVAKPVLYFGHVDSLAFQESVNREAGLFPAGRFGMGRESALSHKRASSLKFFFVQILSLLKSL
jgi:hypothetical protein